jgi:hypothetical protein
METKTLSGDLLGGVFFALSDVDFESGGKV